MFISSDELKKMMASDEEMEAFIAVLGLIKKMEEAGWRRGEAIQFLATMMGVMSWEQHRC